MSEPQPISGKPIWLGFPRCVGRCRPGKSSLSFPRFWSCRDWGIYEPGMGSCLPRVRRKCPPLMGLYPPSTALRSSHQSTISQRDWSFLAVGALSTGERSVVLPRLVEGLDISNDLWTGDGILSSSSGAGPTHEPQSVRDQPVGLGFPHRAGRYQLG